MRSYDYVSDNDSVGNAFVSSKIKLENKPWRFMSSCSSSTSAAAAPANVMWQCGIEIINRMNNEAVGCVSSSATEVVDNGYISKNFDRYPKINGKGIKTLGGNLTIFDFLDSLSKLTFEIASKSFFKMTAEGVLGKKSWYVEKVASGQYHITYPYLPNKDFSLKDALPKLCTLTEDNPSFTLKYAGYNRHGVFGTGRDSETSKEFWAWASPQDSAVDVIDTPVKAGWWATTASSNDRNAISFEVNLLGSLLNSEQATSIDLTDAFQNEAELKKMKAAQRAQLAKETDESGLKVSNQTKFSISVVRRPSRSNLSGMNTFEVWVDNKCLSCPIRNTTTWLSNGRSLFERSVSMTFKPLPDNDTVIECTEVDNVTSGVTYIETTHVVKKVALTHLNYIPQKCSEKTVIEQILDSRLALDKIESVAYNTFGTIVLIKWPLRESFLRSFRWGTYPKQLVLEGEMGENAREGEDSLTTHNKSGSIRFCINSLSNPSKARAMINFAPAHILTPDQVTFHVGVLKAKKEELSKDHPSI